MSPAARAKAQKRQQRYDQTEARKEKKRKAALARYYKLRGELRPPLCKVCGARVIWNGKGRQAATCDEHCSRDELRRRLLQRAKENT